MTQSMGLRDRKRMETRIRIEEAALFLTLRDGIDATTIDAISERADISPRTFFNYFESKDSAILGVHPLELTDDLMAEHIAAHRTEDLVPSVVRLLLTVMGSPLTKRPTLHEDRLEAMRRHPEVLSGQLAQLNARAGRLTETIEQLMTLTTTPPLTTDDADRRAQAELLLALCGTAVRVAAREWATQTTNADTTQVEKRAVALVRQIRGSLT